jgi:hypothetical protein
MKHLEFKVISILVSLAFFSFGVSAYALTVDTSTLDTMQTVSHGPFGVVNWPGVTMQLSSNGAGTTSLVLDVKSPVRVDGPSWMTLDEPQSTALSRIVKSADGTLTLEHVEVSVEPKLPTLQVTSRSTVHLTEIARLDPKLDRARPIPVYAYRRTDGHVVIVARASGQVIAKSNEGDQASCGGKCVYDAATWTNEMLDLDLAKDHPVAQARGDVEFDEAPKGEANAPYTYVINASYTRTSRDPAPVVAITLRTMETVFRGESDGE